MVQSYGMWPIVQGWINANPELKFNPRCFNLCISACTSVCFTTSEEKTSIDPDKISEEIFSNW